MRCYYCGAELDAGPTCPKCREDVRIWKKICAASNRLYNEGLEKAQIRDLSGAEEALKQSLRFNKANVPARNLLGLIYYETGDSVAALSEWVISKSMDEDDSLASYYIARVQNDAAQLADVNMSLRKFNQCLTYCREGNCDVALIQLKKVVSMNPKLIKGQQLLALLYMQVGQYDLAMRLLREALRIDTGNTMTQRYMKECHEKMEHGMRRKTEKSGSEEETADRQSGNVRFRRPAEILSRFTSRISNGFADNSMARTVLYLLLGAAIGVAFVCFLVVPGVRQRANTKAAAQIVETDQILGVRDQTIQTMQAEMEAQDRQIEDALDAVEEADGRTRSYQALLNAYEYFVEGDYEATDGELADVNRELLESEGLELYDGMSDTIEGITLENAYYTGLSLYDSHSYEEASEQFARIVESRPDYDEGGAAYYLAYSCYHMGYFEEAVKWFYVALDYATSQRLIDISQDMIDMLEAEGYSAAE